MNQLILIPESYGATQTLESRGLMFDVSDFLNKYFRYARIPSYVKPEHDLPLPLISENVSETFLSLVPGESRDDKVYWINNAICRAAFDCNWESRPYVRIDEDEQKILDDLCADVTVRIDSGVIASIEALKKYLAQIWYDKNGPSIFKS